MMIQVLGEYGTRAKDKFSTSFKISDDTVIDAGNLFFSEELKSIKNIFISHAHLDHIVDIPFFLDNYFFERKDTLNIYATRENIKILKENFFNDKIWPDFTKIKLTSGKIALKYNEINIGDVIEFEKFKIEFVKVNHTIETIGFLINDKTFISSDTYLDDSLIKYLKEKRIKNLIIEISFPSKFSKLAEISKHLTPKLLKEFLKELKLDNIYIYHLKPCLEEEIKKEIKDYFILKSGDVIDLINGQVYRRKDLKKEELFKIIKSFSTEKNIDKILNLILTYARKITNADAGSLYIKTDDDKYLEFKVVQNNTLNINMTENINWPKLPIYEKDRNYNMRMVAVVSAVTGKIINLKDVYKSKKYNFSGTKAFDKKTGYRSKSMLVIPLKNHEGEIIGVLQLINKKYKNEIIAFNKDDEEIIYFLAGIAAVALTKNKLIKDFEKLFDSFVKTIALAIDKKSKHTSGHIRRVAKIALMIATEMKNQKIKNYTDLDLKIIQIAGLLHDIGKITTPEYLLDKSKKLEIFSDKIDEIKYRFEVLKKEKEIEYLKNKISKEEYLNFISQIEDDFKFLVELNKGSEYVSDEQINHLKKIKEYKILNNQPLLTDEEFELLSIRKGTLSEKEIEKIREHAKNGIEMLQSIYFPKKYKKIVNIAANHHEKLNCKGYPKGLCEKDLSLEERLMAIADIFEALSAKDRPYKEPKKLSEIFKILYFMAKEKEIDKSIISFILKNNLHLKYAEEELDKDQIDEIDEEIKNFFLN